MDRYIDGEVKDWKFTKVYKWMRNDFTEWEQQLNIIAYILKDNDNPVSKLSIIMHLRDFSANETFKKGYPDCEWQIVNLNLWSTMAQKSYILERLLLLDENSKLDDSELLPCTQKEMWQDDSKWAIMKEGNVKATKVFDTEEEAMDFIDEAPAKTKDSYSIKEREAVRRRCVGYCDCSNHCHQHKSYMESKNGIQQEDSEPCIF